MNDGWSSNFSYSYYRKLMLVIKDTYKLHLLHEAPQLLNNLQGRPKILLRHDIDLDLDKALAMAEIESELNISSCYMIMTNCPFYALDDKKTISFLYELDKYGHEIGLHFDFDKQHDRNNDANIDCLADAFESSARQLEDIISSKVRSISFHRPLPQFIKGPLLVSGRVNAYSAELMAWYLSDSKGNWRNGEPLPMLENPAKPILQLLVHPIWWGITHMPASNRLQQYFESRTEGLSNDQINDFDNKLSGHLTMHRSGKNRRESWG